ncbi:MAG: hypothetical protein IKZ82_11675 [Clostridia bacterium]|nr:hypothetical protein [Clostridia bacterium]
MAKIKVDYRTLEQASIAIEQYLSTHNNKMNKANAAMVELGNYWSGEDYTATYALWENVDRGASASNSMMKSLRNYAEFLKMASRKYKNAQENAVQRANRLPK